MDVREKLVELICRFCSGLSVSDITPPYGYENLADFLISNGVTVQELGGCEYCNDDKSIYHRSSEIHDSMDEDVYISGNCLIVDIGCRSYGCASINFCPMCGRRLHSPKPATKKPNS